MISQTSMISRTPLTTINRALKALVSRIKVYGIVQGVGFRPFVARLAERFSLDGTVANKGSYVEIIARGLDEALNNFIAALRAEAPPRAHIIDIDVKVLDADAFSFDGFSIIDSERAGGSMFVSPDIAICAQCRAELFDPNNRRYLHPFINCTDCGPRLTVMKRLPYDRERTSMSEFPMCRECSTEYYDPSSRRYDAQPVCCNDCGPTVYILDGRERGLEAISSARKTIIDGGIVALKGIGGFHLACDAYNRSAVERLRQRKFRPSKPFAVMFKDIESVRRECVLDNRMLGLLDDHRKPIVLLEKKIVDVEAQKGNEKKSVGRIADNVAPFNRRLGVMLPYTPLHHLIFDLPDGQSVSDALIMTSGNISGAPIAITDDDVRELSSIADVILSHDREILIRADDSVVDGDGVMIRRSRGHAPLPIHVNRELNGEVLALGGELKNCFCLAKGNLFYLSPYVGDLTDLRTVEALRQSLGRMIELLEIEPRKIICDLHPRYHSTELAEEISARLDIPLIKIQHHYAHILSCMAENNHFERVIGVAFDGTGFGSDGSIWGGEFLIADLNGFERFASIDPFEQAGGDRSSIEAWRSAISMLTSTVGLERAKKTALELGLADEMMIDAQLFLIKNDINSVRSTSAGRLFDAVSAVLGLCSTSTFEGEAAMRLQYAAESGDRLAAAFHVGLAEFIVRTCKRARASTGISTAALSGGVFQNSLLLRLTVERLKANSFRVLTHRLVPANDGGLALGQALYAMNGL